MRGLAGALEAFLPLAANGAGATFLPVDFLAGA